MIKPNVERKKKDSRILEILQEKMEKTRFLTKNIIPTNIRLVSGEGAIVKDAFEKEYLDFSSQTLNLNLGQKHPLIKKAAEESLNSLTFMSSRFANNYLLDLAEKLIETAPNGLNKVNLKLSNGSDANESAIKRIRCFREKPFIISFNRSHIGESSETLAASGHTIGKSFLGGSKEYLFAPPFYCYRCKNNEKCSFECAKEIELILKSRNDIAGIICEPVMVDGGVLVAPREYLKNLREICNSYNISLIFDEIQTAFGWVGDFYVSNLFKIEPDLLTLGKALSSGYPLSAVLMKQEYDVIDYGYDEFTYGGHPLSCATALANINFLSNTDIFEKVKEKSKILTRELKKLQSEFQIIGDVRGIGLLQGIEIISKNKNPECNLTHAIYDKCLSKGLILRIAQGGQGNVLIIKPPIIIKEEEILKAIGILREVLSEIK